jgi:hypothetical protein
MKILFLTSLLLFSEIIFCLAQDVITLKSGEDIQAKVEVVNQAEVIYKRFDNLNGPRIIIPKSDILMIRYENGVKEIFHDENIVPDTNSSNTFNSTLYNKGQKDAVIYYKGYSGAGTVTLITGLLSPLVGLIPAIACSSTPPKDVNLNYPNTAMMKKPDYYNGYTQKAKKIKQGKVWTNWGIALGINIVAIIIIESGN